VLRMSLLAISLVSVAADIAQRVGELCCASCMYAKHIAPANVASSAVLVPEGRQLYASDWEWRSLAKMSSLYRRISMRPVDLTSCLLLRCLWLHHEAHFKRLRPGIEADRTGTN
jgi:hypothetical protein